MSDRRKVGAVFTAQTATSRRGGARMSENGIEAVAVDMAEAAELQPDRSRILDAAAALAVLGDRETHFAQYVGEGRCREGRFKCDPDEHGNPQSLTYWQLKRKACPEAHALRDGSREQQKAAAKCAVRLWFSARRRCASAPSAGSDRIAGAFSGYGFGLYCGAPSSVARAHAWRVTRAKLAALTRKETTDGK